MPNHVTLIGLTGPSFDDEGEPRDFSSLKDANLCTLVRPMPEEVKGEVPGPNPPWRVWALENWGTKWGTYDTQIHELSGDGGPLLIETLCAWSPPHEECMRDISKFLAEEFGLRSIAWTCYDPRDCTAHMMRSWVDLAAL